MTSHLYFEQIVFLTGFLSQYAYQDSKLLPCLIQWYIHSFLLADVEQKSSVLYSPLTSFNWCCKVYAIRQALRAYCPQIYNVIIVVPLLLCKVNSKVNSKVTVTLRYTEALKLHCFFQKTVHASSRLLAQNRVSQVFWEPIKHCRLELSLRKT